jgi:hypothetical protein
VKSCAILFLILACLISASCATLLKGKTDQITVISDPAGAQVSVDGDVKGTTPVSFEVPSKEDLNIHVAKDGYQPQDLNNPAKTRWGWETFSFFSYVIPVFVDMGTGAAWGHDELTMTTHLEPLAQASPATASAGASPAASASPAAAAASPIGRGESPAAAASPASQSSPVAVASPAASPSPAAQAASAAPVPAQQ